MVGCIIKRKKSWYSRARIWRHRNLFISHLIDVLFVLFIQYIWNTQQSFSNGHFSTHAVSYSLLCSVSQFVNPFLSVCPSPSSAYSPLFSYLAPFYIKGNQFVWPASLNKLIQTNVVPHSGLAHNIIGTVNKLRKKWSVVNAASDTPLNYECLKFCEIDLIGSSVNFGLECLFLSCNTQSISLASAKCNKSFLQ